ncbi:hypothetical protein BTR23_18065 [Alkalihalophilus pseudofirmus]|nr:hypothetical protein BTR23_18065 [Alkalihalophilus pseudofirmus]
MRRILGFLIGVLYTDWLFHTRHVYALELTATTTLEWIGALAIGGGATILFFTLCRKFFPISFFHGVIAASGFFASLISLYFTGYLIYTD